MKSAVDSNPNNNSSVILYTEEDDYFDSFQCPHNCEDTHYYIIFSATATYFTTYDTLSYFDANEEMDEPLHVDYSMENEGEEYLAFYDYLTEESLCTSMIE